ncbi:proton-conducting transporter transmembrane domain-containing protein [Geomonas azotofigens]|uniref:proton-conducting transporter transmembrane domain-containing protein n=1 Tax=Geomonas azotofigens TaxID=2843196 RepID=UPI001C10449C|nr:proton-conducting transporter membrane subunit [Geomonas azotofigens]MBU5613188.1 hydrogenase [Geomonas azotofigens]
MTFSGEPATSLGLLLLAVCCQAASGVPLLLRPGSSVAQRAGVALMVAASLAGCAGALGAVFLPVAGTWFLPSGLPFGGLEIGVDALSALFLLPILIVTGCCAVYGAGYWPVARHPGHGGKLAFFLGLLSAALTMVLVARSTLLFLMAWEVMAFSAYFALTTEDEKPQVREAGVLYLITAHLGALALFATFSLLNAATGAYLFPAQGSLPAAGPLATAIFLTALFGFGMKAGMMPLHIWLPSAHANAPSHVSAILSGVVLKTGIYGMMRVFSAFADPPLWWGGMVLVLGSISAVLGVAYAIGQHDLKRLLAYHSIENIGIILMGLGMALIGANQGWEALIALGAAGALLHVINHALFKALLFLSAGSVIHATGTREIDLLGGVGRRMPKTALFFLAGAVAICGLPPLNGFVSELMIYLGAFNSIGAAVGLGPSLPALAAPVLALVGGLAVACFVKVYGVVFLGAPRSPEHEAGHEAGVGMLVPMAVLASCCAVIGLAPGLFGGILNEALVDYRQSLAAHGIAGLVPFAWISIVGVGLLLLLALLWLFFAKRAARLPVAVAPTWGCGYLRPTPRMQYSASSFGATVVGWFALLLRPERHRCEVEGLFPGHSSHESHLPETVLEKGYLPFLEYLFEKAQPVRRLQHGKLNIYIFYTFVTLVLLLAITSGY